MFQRRRDRYTSIWLLVAGMLGVAGYACDYPTSPPTPVNITILNNQQQGQSPTPSGTPGSCGGITVAYLGLSARNMDGELVSQVGRGEILQLDVTPKDASGTPVPAACHAPTASWAPNGPCTLEGNVNGFNPRLRGGSLAGQCIVTASVGTLTGALTLTVR